MPVSPSPWGPPTNEDTACYRERIEAPLPQLQPRPTCERLELPFSCDAILSGYEDLASSGSDQCTMWGKMSHQEILAEHVVDIHKVVADFRDVFERIQSSSSQSYGVNKYFSSQSPMQKRLSIYNWNPGPRRGTEDAIEKQIAVKWHIVTLQEASSMSNTKFLMNDFTGPTLRAARFSSTRTPSTLTSASNRSSFMTRGEVCKIISLKENRDGFYKAFFHVPLFVELQSVVRRSSLYYRCTSAIFMPRKKGFAKKIIQTIPAIFISQDIDLDAGDFNGTAWHCRSRDNLSTIDEVFSDCALPTPPGPTPLWRPGSVPNNWADVCGFLKPPGSQRFWKVNKHGAFSILRQALGFTTK